MTKEEQQDWNDTHESLWALAEQERELLENYEHYFKNFKLDSNQDSTILHYRNKIKSMLSDAKDHVRDIESELQMLDIRHA